MCIDTIATLDNLSPDERGQKIREFLICPVCGYSGDPAEGGGFRFLENISVFRVILGVQDGLLKITGRSDTDDGYDDGTNWRIECRRTRPRFCGHEWPVPEWLAEYMDWVD